jgi:hypothetical protein
LLGICIFRLPTAGDSTTLTVEEIAAALSDKAPATDIELRAWVRSGDDRLDRTTVEIKCSNTGAASALLGEDALRLDVSLEGKRLSRLGPSGFDSSETVFVPPIASGYDQIKPAVVCGTGRANSVRLAKRRWSPGMTASVSLEFYDPPPDTISVVITVRVDEVHVRKETQSLKVERTSARE